MILSPKMIKSKNKTTYIKSMIKGIYYKIY